MREVGLTETLDEAELHRLVGRAVKGLRERAGLSMRALAARAGVSQPFLSQVERGLSAPSMSTVYRLAEALGVVPGDLLPTPGHGSVAVVRAGEGRALPVADRPDAAVGHIMMSRSDRMLEVLDYRIEPGQYLEEWFEGESEMAVYVIEGTLGIEVEGHGAWRLGPGDLISYPGSARHRWVKADDRPVHALLVIARGARA